MGSRVSQDRTAREKRAKGERMECSGCDKFFGEKLLYLTPNGMKCNKCIDGDDLDEYKDNPLSQKVGYFADESEEKNDCE